VSAPRASSRAAPVRALATVAALAALGAGCQGSPSLPKIGPVRVAEGALADPLREAGLSADGIGAAARDALAAAGFREGDAATALRVRVDVLSVRLAPPRPGSTAATVEVVVELAVSPASGQEGAAQRESAAGAAPLQGDSAGAWSAAVAQGARLAAEALAIGFAQEKKPVEALIADLDAGDARVREAAVRVLADRRSAAAVPALVARLQDPDPDVKHRAVGALAQIRDPRAVGPLIDVARRGDPALASRLAHIIGDIGGPEARGYLLTLEAGHPDPKVAAAAREALRDLDRRAAEAAGAAASK
jgi:hypothetical protein